MGTIKQIVVFFFVLTAVTVLSSQAGEYDSWLHSQSIDVSQNEKLNINGSTILILHLTENNFLFNDAKSDGADFRCATADGVALPYFIDRWDAEKKYTDIFIKMPDPATTFILIYYGNASAASTGDKNAIFGEQNNPAAPQPVTE